MDVPLTTLQRRPNRQDITILQRLIMLCRGQKYAIFHHGLYLVRGDFVAREQLQRRQWGIRIGGDNEGIVIAVIAAITRL